MDGAAAMLDSAEARALSPHEAYPDALRALDEGEATARRFALIEGEGAPGVMVDETRPGEVAGQALIVTTYEGEKQPRRARVIAKRDDGALVMPSMDNIDREVRVVFEPPLLVFPAALDPGATVREQSKMTVHPIDKPARVKERGTGTIDITFVALERIELHGKPVDAARVRVVFRSDLRAADAEHVTERWLDPGGEEEGADAARAGSGTLRESWAEEVVVLGLAKTTTRQTFEVEAGQ
jgi:hypothetical protein